MRGEGSEDEVVENKSREEEDGRRKGSCADMEFSLTCAAFLRAVGFHYRHNFTIFACTRPQCRRPDCKSKEFVIC